MVDLKLNCRECGRLTVLTVQEQAAALRELTLPAHRKVIECGCGRYQFVLSAEAVRSPISATKRPGIQPTEPLFHRFCSTERPRN